MSKFWWVIAIIVVSGAVAFEVLGGGQTSAPSPPPQRRIQVATAVAVRKNSPLIIEALGNVTTFASVAIKPRIDDEIVGVHFADGAEVKVGDLLITLDTRALEAQLHQAEGTLERDRARLLGAERDIRRYLVLLPQGATPQLNLELATTQRDTYRGAMLVDEAAIRALKVQLSFCEIHAPIDGRISQANFKVGNIVHSSDSIPIATINQTRPIYVTFQVAQDDLPAVRAAMAAGSVSVEAAAEHDIRASYGRISMIENIIDPTTGLATVRATMPNDDELLWPGAIVTVSVTLDIENAVVVPNSAIQVSPGGAYVYVVENGIAFQQPVDVSRSTKDEAVIKSGLSGSESVVINGHLLLSEGAPVTAVDQ